MSAARTRCSRGRATSPTARPRPTRRTRSGCWPPSSASSASASTGSTPTRSSGAPASSPAAGARSGRRSTASPSPSSGRSTPSGRCWGARSCPSTGRRPRSCSDGAGTRGGKRDGSPHPGDPQPGRRGGGPGRPRGPAVTSPTAVVAVDLGASGGRVMVGIAGGAGDDQLKLLEMHRFPNVPVMVLGTLHWDILSLFQGVLDGIRAAAAAGDVASLGIDAWGDDYGLLDEDGELLGNPVHYRDTRTEGVPRQVLSRVPAAELYATTGIQLLPLNTIFQLAAATGSPQLAAARTLLMIPDLLAFWLTGQAGAEVTIASTTQLYDVRAQAWATSLMTRAGLRPDIFPPLRRPGEAIGDLLPWLAAEAGLATPVPVRAVGSHDTASAVVGVPADGPDFAYISCGTWSLVGMELPAPVLS